jgi:hypothetical protein
MDVRIFGVLFCPAQVEALRCADHPQREYYKLSVAFLFLEARAKTEQARRSDRETEE